MRGEAVIYDVLFVALWLEDLNLLRGGVVELFEYGVR